LAAAVAADGEVEAVDIAAAATTGVVEDAGSVAAHETTEFAKPGVTAGAAEAAPLAGVERADMAAAQRPAADTSVAGGPAEDGAEEAEGEADEAEAVGGIGGPIQDH